MVDLGPIEPILVAGSKYCADWGFGMTWLRNEYWSCHCRHLGPVSSLRNRNLSSG
jgi:hypothetical protein